MHNELTQVVFGAGLALAGLTAGVIGSKWWHRARTTRQTRFEATTRLDEGDDVKTKRRLDQALAELRDLREALPPVERILVERRKNNAGPPDGLERRRNRRAMVCE